MNVFYSKYKSKRLEYTKKKVPNKNDIQLIQAYTNPCIHSNELNFLKENIIIKYKINNSELDEIISLNLLLEDYKDLIQI